MRKVLAGLAGGLLAGGATFGLLGLGRGRAAIGLFHGVSVATGFLVTIAVGEGWLAGRRFLRNLGVAVTLFALALVVAAVTGSCLSLLGWFGSSQPEQGLLRAVGELTGLYLLFGFMFAGWWAIPMMAAIGLAWQRWWGVRFDASTAEVKPHG